MTIRGRLSGWFASTAMAALPLNAPAFAQDDDFTGMMSSMEPELYCVFDVLSQNGDFHAIVDSNERRQGSFAVFDGQIP